MSDNKDVDKILFQNTELTAEEKEELLKQDQNVARILQEEENKMLAAWDKLKLGENKSFPEENYKRTTFVINLNKNPKPINKQPPQKITQEVTQQVVQN